MFKGIDVSEHQRDVDWASVKSSGIDFAIIRAGFARIGNGGRADYYFEKNYQGAKNAGVPLGAYWYSYAVNVDQAKGEAESFIQLLSGKKFEYPVYFDVEDPTMANLGRPLITEITLTFCQAVQAAGYFVGVYANTDWLKNRLDLSKVSAFTIWKADYRTNFDTTIPCDIHQYTSTGSVSGVNGNVDLNNGYRDFPAEIVNKGVNGWPLAAWSKGDKCKIHGRVLKWASGETISPKDYVYRVTKVEGDKVYGEMEYQPKKVVRDNDIYDPDFKPWSVGDKCRIHGGVSKWATGETMNPKDYLYRVTRVEGDKVYGEITYQPKKVLRDNEIYK